MNRDEALKLCGIVGPLATGQSYGMGEAANHALADTLKRSFPEFNWRVFLDRSGERTRWSVTVDDNEPREKMPVECFNHDGEFPCGARVVNMGKVEPTAVRPTDYDGTLGNSEHGVWYCSVGCRDEAEVEHEKRLRDMLADTLPRGEKRPAKVTLSGKPAATPDGPAPQPIDETSGQHKDHWILSPGERAKGFVRPVRLSYKHVGERPRFPLRDLTEQEKIDQAPYGYVKFEKYPESESPVTGRMWTQAQLDSGCGVVTSMPRPIAETWARDLSFYGQTMCCGCRAYLPVGEFEWDDGSKLGT